MRTGTVFGTWGHVTITPKRVRRELVELAGLQPINTRIAKLAAWSFTAYRGPLVSVPRSLRRYLGRYIGGAR